MESKGSLRHPARSWLAQKTFALLLPRTVHPTITRRYRPMYLNYNKSTLSAPNSIFLPTWMTSPYQDGRVSWCDFDNTQLLLSLVGPNSWRGKKPSFENAPLSFNSIVLYFDGYLSPNGKKTREFLQVADLIRSTPTGLAQYVAPRKATHALLAELLYIPRTRRDKDSNEQAAKEWYQSQSDFNKRNQITVYDTSLVVYDPKNAHFQSLTTFFYCCYSLEQDIRQD